MNCIYSLTCFYSDPNDILSKFSCLVCTCFQYLYINSKDTVKELSFIIRYVPDQYKTKKMCDKEIQENDGMLGFIPDYCKDQKMCDKSVDNYSHASKYVSGCYKTQKIWDKAANNYPSAIQLAPNC